MIKYGIFIIAVIIIIQGCDNDEYGKRSVLIFSGHHEPKPNEITKESFMGEYYCPFPLGEFVLEFKSLSEDLRGKFDKDKEYDGVYQQRIYWKSGRVFKSEWQIFLIRGLYSERPAVMLCNLKFCLMRNEVNSEWQYPLEREPNEHEISAYPSISVVVHLGFNYYREITILIGVDPEIYYAKRSKKYQTQ